MELLDSLAIYFVEYAMCNRNGDWLNVQDMAAENFAVGRSSCFVVSLFESLSENYIYEYTAYNSIDPASLIWDNWSRFERGG